MHIHTTRQCCSACIHAKSINSRAHCITPRSTTSLRVTCLYWCNAELLKAQSFIAVLVIELCEAAYDSVGAAAPLTHRQQQYMRIYTAQLLSRIKRVSVTMSRALSGRVKGQVVCRLCQAEYELLERTAPPSRG